MFRQKLPLDKFASDKLIFDSGFIEQHDQYLLKVYTFKIIKTLENAVSVNDLFLRIEVELFVIKFSNFHFNSDSKELY